MVPKERKKASVRVSIHSAPNSAAFASRIDFHPDPDVSFFGIRARSGGFFPN